ncbi:MAG: DUF1573 domain-containing protein, partial [Chitinophagaceae bacterium]
MLSMKKLLPFLFCVLTASFVSAQGTSVPAKPVATQPAPVEILGLKETTHDFGKIPQSRPVTYNFEFKNNGKEPLILENVQASCGCTTPEWSKEPVEAGATSTIKVGYNAAAEGQFS